MVKRNIDNLHIARDLEASILDSESREIHQKKLKYSRVEQNNDDEDDEEEDEDEEEEREQEEDEAEDTDEIEALDDDSDEDVEMENVEKKEKKFLIRKRRSANIYPKATAGQSPLSVKYASNYNYEKDKDLVKPYFSSIVYNLSVSIIYFSLH